MATVDTVPLARHRYDWKHHAKRLAVTWARWLHIYLSMASFAILLFFAVTGLTLNHQDWFAKQQRTFTYKGTVERSWVRPPAGKEVAKLEVAEFLRRTYNIRAALTDFRVDDAQISVNFKGPGYTADTFIDRDTGAFEVTETRMGWGAVINDLHKGRDSGRTWGVLIDASAVLMTLVAATGLALIFFLAKWRRSGLTALALGAVAGYALYVAFVP